MCAADRRAAGEEEDEEWEDVDEEIPRDHLHHSHRSPSPLTDAPSSRAPSPELESGRSFSTKGGKKKRQQRARQKAAQAAPFGPPPKVIHSQAHREQPRHETTFNAKDVRAGSYYVQQSKVIVDAEGRIIAVLLGRPEG
ncbi:hypothetical protein B0H14DRAFT_3163547 [Mycena olivaceomarginata]|nr:hypothetical protein B0H14DRAFT_3163547 [Mycena olivaceomarginata]